MMTYWNWVRRQPVIRPTKSFNFEISCRSTLQKGADSFAKCEIR